MTALAIDEVTSKSQSPSSLAPAYSEKKGALISVDGVEENQDNGTSKILPIFSIRSAIIDGDDDALKYANAHHGKTIPPEMDKRLLRKADIHITTVLALINGVAFADKVLASNGVILGLTVDNDMQEGGRFGWTTSAFYLAYLIMSPILVVIVKLPPAKVVSLALMGWGIVVCCTAATSSYAGFMACRVILGMLESTQVPAQVVITSQWYKSSEHFSRTCVWFAWNGLWGLVGTLIAYGLRVRLDNNDISIRPWKVPYIFFGLLTFLIGIFVYFFLPDSPAQAKFLTDEEKEWHVERIRENKQGYGSHKFKWSHIWEAVRDIRTWIIMIAVVFENTVNGIVTTFSSLILSGMHFGPQKVLLMTLPQNATEFVGCYVVFFLSARFFVNHRSVWAIFCAGINVMSLCFVAWGPNTKMQLAGISLFSWVGPVSYVSFISWIETNTAGHTKKVFVNSILLVSYCLGNFIGPFAMKDSQKPEYPTGKTFMAASACITFIMMILMVVVNYTANKRRDAKGEKLPKGLENAEFADLTDFENPEFRYAL